MSLAYFRRVYGNFNVVDNEALSASDFTPYSVLVPTTSTPGGTLPGAGTMIGGLFDPNSTAVNNVIKDASAFGKQQAHWDGFDISVDARLRNGLFLQGGVSSGKDLFDYCDIVDDVPEALTPQAQATITSPLAVAGSVTPAGSCKQATPFLTQWKGLASYTLPWWGIRLSGTFQSLYGPQLAATNIYNNTNRTTTTTLARPFTLGQATVNLYEPVSKPFLTQWKGLASYTLPYGIRVSGTFQSLYGPPLVATNIYNNGNRTTTTTLPRPFTAGQATVNLYEPVSKYGDRLNQIDLRLTKIVNVGHGRIDLNVDFYNAFNSDAVIGELGAFGPAWRLPLTVIQPRFVKFEARYDF